MSKYLDINGLTELWRQIRNTLSAYAKRDDTSQTISASYIQLGKDKYDLMTDDDGHLWVNGERVLTEENDAQHVVGEKVTSPLVVVEELWIGSNEDVLSIEEGVLKLNGEYAFGDYAKQSDIDSIFTESEVIND